MTIMKLDPYINVKSGCYEPNPTREVFVTEDGAETDPRPRALRAFHTYHK
ncbi:hypothetical protein ACNKHL_16830 [Shigella flexneri]